MTFMDSKWHFLGCAATSATPNSLNPPRLSPRHFLPCSCSILPELLGLVFISPTSSSCTTATWFWWGYRLHLGHGKHGLKGSPSDICPDLESWPCSALESFPRRAQLHFHTSWKLEWSSHKLNLGKIPPYSRARHLLPSWKSFSTLRNQIAIACKVPDSSVYTGHSLLSFASFQRLEEQGFFSLFFQVKMH